jgi:hypothetical protein
MFDHILEDYPAHLSTRALQRDDPAVLLEEAEEWLREEGILFPAELAIQKIIAQVCPQAEQQVFAAITRQITTTQAQALEKLLQREQGKRGSTLAWLKEPAVKASPPAIKMLITKPETIRHRIGFLLLPGYTAGLQTLCWIFAPYASKFGFCLDDSTLTIENALVRDRSSYKQCQLECQASYKP